MERSLSVEEQLAQVQRQLLALSQLPSTIQVTLDAVTQQLAQIVSASQSTVEEVTYEAVVAEEQEEQEVTYVTTEGTAQKEWLNRFFVETLVFYRQVA